MESYSTDLRKKVLAAYGRGMTTKNIAEAFSVSTAWARRVRQQHREEGRIAPKPRGLGAVPPRYKIDRARLAELVEQHPDATLEELRDSLDVGCSISGVCMALKELRISYKKRRSTRANKIGPMSPSAAPSGSSGASALIPRG